MSVSKVVKVFVNTRSHNSSVMSVLLVFIRLRHYKRLKHSPHTKLPQTMHAQQGGALTHLGLSSARECNLWVNLRERVQKRRGLVSVVPWYRWTCNLSPSLSILWHHTLSFHSLTTHQWRCIISVLSSSWLRNMCSPILHQSNDVKDICLF